MTGFARTLRAAGVPADPERTQGLLRALSHLDAADPADVYWAGRLTLCAVGRRPAPLRPVLRRVLLRAPRGPYEPRRRSPSSGTPRRVTGPARSGGERRASPLAATASATEVLRLATWPGSARRNAPRCTGCSPCCGRARHSAGRDVSPPAHRGRLDGRTTVRATLRRGGEIAGLRYRAHRTRPRRVVLLVDVSGSMTPYADTLLGLAHALVRSEPRATEVFSAGTRLTRLTAELSHRDPAAAMNAVSRAIPTGAAAPGWGRSSGGSWRWTTRRRRDGGDRVRRVGARRRSLLGEQMARLSRTAHRVIWVNPHKGQRATSRSPPVCGQPFPTSTTSWPGTAWPPSKNWQGCWEARVRDVLSQILRWWEAGETFGLATVVNTFRSAPRPPGASMAVLGDEAEGSVSGGCVEGAVYELAREVVASGTPVAAAVRRERRRRLLGRPDLRRHPGRVRRAGLRGDLSRAGGGRRLGARARAGGGGDGPVGARLGRHPQGDLAGPFLGLAGRRTG